ncbi:MAG TPA: hypothetical protein VFF69_05965 [Phycisphaerales bacterium]|nr:hypothetical protein [Phycisphaerales bacterium]
MDPLGVPARIGPSYDEEKVCGMRLDPEQQGWLARALAALHTGDEKRFEDSLWLGFGDQWQPLKVALVRQGYLQNGDGRALSLAERGEQLLVKLARDDASSKSGSIAGLSDSMLNGTLRDTTGKPR